MVRSAPVAAVVVLVGCASRAPAPAEPAVASFEERLASNVVWQPGDREPVERDVARWSAIDQGAAMQPMTWLVEIRNRCSVPAVFAVGPAEESPPADAPRNELAPGDAISTWIPGGDALHLLDPRGGPSVKATLAAKHVVFLGEDDCDRIAQR